MRYRRATKYQLKKLEAAFARADRQAALKAQDGRCAYCLCPLTARTVTRDHVTPRSAGGLNHRENIVAACETCNQAKGSMPASLFKRMIHNPGPADPTRYWVIWFEYRLNVALIRMERNVMRKVGRRI